MPSERWQERPGKSRRKVYIMTRKQYIHKLQSLVIAIHRASENEYKLGESLRHVRDNAKNAPGNFGSYDAAWNSKEIKWIRDYYGVG